ncbi:fumarylacetoacetate hydrolase family protein [Roseateles sp.]|uniref:2-keto-4-pentenoate hydratase n=1 Tax=Roseateles sp. TaxID=1971397 RepID=UPI0031CF03B7
MSGLNQLALALDQAALTRQAVAQLSDQHPDFDVETAYAVQRLLVQQRLRRGARRVGMKMGFTSVAKMRQMGVDQMIWGRLTDDMRLDEGGELALDRYVHPRAEPEIVFLLRKPLAGRVSAAEAMAAVEAVAGGIEIIDSRYRDFRFHLADVVADNASSSGFLVGPLQPASTDVANLGIVMRVDGRVVQAGSSAAILGHPVRSLVAAARLAGEAGESLQPGDLVLAGAATEAVALRAGMRVSAAFQSLGAVSFQVGGTES